ncbi:hypothetical protein B7463_g11752, partial [Scytalidium lignicola]
METSAVLLYLLKFADKDYQFGFKDELEQSDCIQWLFFWHGGGVPYQSNLRYFRRGTEQSPFAIQRFRKETFQVFGVLEIRLSGKYTGEPRDYLTGNGKGTYSVADIGTWGSVRYWQRYGYTKEEMQGFPHLLQWIARIAERPAVKKVTGDLRV